MDKGWILIELLPQQLINGLTIGSVYALIALGYTMVYGVLQLINFAHGDLFMLGAMVAVFVLAGMAVTEPLSLVVAIPLLVGVFLVSMTVIAALGVTIERVAYRPLRNASRLAPLISALGRLGVPRERHDERGGPGPAVLPRDHSRHRVRVPRASRSRTGRSSSCSWRPR